MNTLKPRQFQYTRSIRQLTNKSSTTPFANGFQVGKPAYNLYKFRIGMDVGNGIYLGFIYMPKRKMVQQVIESINTEIFFQ